MTAESVFDPRSVPVRFSNLKLMGKSPAHYLHAIRYGRPDRPAYRTGRLVHSLVFGQGGWVVYDGGTRCGKAWDAFRLEHAAQEIYTVSEYDSASPIADSILRHPLADTLLRTGDIETRLRWQIDGRDCHGTPDVASDSHLVDLKTAQDGEPFRFSRTALGYGYHAQLAWYQDARELAGFKRPSDVFVWAVEKQAPYVCSVFRVTERALDQGRRMTRLWWEQLRVCEESGHWPGYAQTILELDVPDESPGVLDFDEEELVA